MTIITLSGDPGSGKSTIAKKIIKYFEKKGKKAKRIYVGGIRRKLAKEKNITLQELNEYAKKNPETDVDVDKQAASEARALNKENDYVIVEGRTQFYFLPESIKLYFKVDLDVATNRIWGDLQKKEINQQRNEGKFKNKDELKQSLIKRGEGDAKRYLKYYGFDHREEKHYNIIINSSYLSIEEQYLKTIEMIENYEKNQRN